LEPFYAGPRSVRLNLSSPEDIEQIRQLEVAVPPHADFRDAEGRRIGGGIVRLQWKEPTTKGCCVTLVILTPEEARSGDPDWLDRESDLANRNARICQDYHDGYSLEGLAEKYSLGERYIRKILRHQRLTK